MNLAGVFAPIPTPFDDHDAVDTHRLRDALGRWVERPLTGFVVLGSNGDMTNFSGLQPDHPEYQNYFTKIHDATLRAGKFLGAVTATYAKAGPPGVGRADFADWRLFYNGPSFDGYQPPRAGPAPRK